MVNGMPYEVRMFQPSDELDVIRLADESEILVVSLGEIDKRPLVVATLDGGVVGCLWGVTEGVLDLDVAVTPAHRGHRLSRRLLAHLVREYELLGREVTLSITSPAMQRLAVECGLIHDGAGNWSGVLRLPRE